MHVFNFYMNKVFLTSLRSDIILDKKALQSIVWLLQGIGNSPKAKKVLGWNWKGEILYSIKNVEILVNNEEAMMEYLYLLCGSRHEILQGWVLKYDVFTLRWKNHGTLELGVREKKTKFQIRFEVLISSSLYERGNVLRPYRTYIDHLKKDKMLNFNEGM